MNELWTWQAVSLAYSSHWVTLTFELQTYVSGKTHSLNVIHIYAKLFQNPSINDSYSYQTSCFITYDTELSNDLKHSLLFC